MRGLLACWLIVFPATAQDLFDRAEAILRARCLPCHNDELKAGGASFASREALLRGGAHGPAIVVGKPDASLLMESLRRHGDLKMPPGAGLSAREIDTLAEWIERGAPWGANPSPAAVPARPPLPFETWTFDRIEDIGGYATSVIGRPRVIDAPLGKAVAFDGVGDALLIEANPLAGAETFTWEAVIRPDPGGGPEQRVLHLQEKGSENRLLLEIRIIGGQWCLDSFAMSSAGFKTLIDRHRLHPLGKWHHVAMVYDGREFRHYVNGIIQGAAEVPWSPLRDGHASAGARLNQVSFFKGAIRLSRMTRGVLSPAEFLKVKGR
jgi:mono/diheme cytochrome c family protein